MADKMQEDKKYDREYEEEYASLKALINSRRKEKGSKPITRTLLAIQLKEPHIQDGDKQIANWLNKRNSEAQKKLDEAHSKQLEHPDLSFTGFNFVYGPVIIAFLESRMKELIRSARTHRGVIEVFGRRD